MKTKFEWDEVKATANLKKHHVSFLDAVHVFSDPFAVVSQDRIENGERRWQTVGMVGGYLLFMVAHTVGEDDTGVEIIRIISARNADKKERKNYENQNR